MKVAALYVTPQSVYKTFPDVDCFDQFRDARTYQGWLPVVAHPPCRAWGRLRHFAKPRSDELALGVHAVHNVRRCGGVLEHPAGSRLWSQMCLPLPGAGPDTYDGVTVACYQSDFGHPALKHTWLYIVDHARPGDLCKVVRAGDLCKVARPGELGKVASQPAPRRMDTPLPFAQFLIGVALACSDAALY